MGLAFEDIDFDNRLIFLTRQIKVAGRDEKLFPYEQELVKSHPELESCRYLARNPKYDSKRIIPISEPLYQLLLKKKQEQERNAVVLGSDYIDYHYTREYEPLVEGRTYESFSKKTNHRGGFTIDRLESGIINPYGIGYPIHFVNARENGELVRPDYVTDILASIQGKTGKGEIMGEFNLHSLRNTYASKARDGQMRDHMIAAIMGHKNVDTTQGYMSVTGEEFYRDTKAIRGLAPMPSKAPQNICDDEIFAYFKSLDATQRKAFMHNLMDIQYESA
jgi:integrase